MAARPRRKPLAPDFDPSRAVTLILADYDEYLLRSLGEAPGDPKAFGGRHAAGRAALTHLEHVLKVGALVGADATQDDVAALLAEARAHAHDDTDEESSTDDPAGGAG